MTIGKLGNKAPGPQDHPATESLTDPEQIRQELVQKFGILEEKVKSEANAIFEQKAKDIREKINIEIEEALTKYKQALLEIEKLINSSNEDDRRIVESVQKMAKENLDDKIKIIAENIRRSLLN